MRHLYMYFKPNWRNDIFFNPNNLLQWTVVHRQSLICRYFSKMKGKLFIRVANLMEQLNIVRKCELCVDNITDINVKDESSNVFFLNLKLVVLFMMVKYTMRGHEGVVRNTLELVCGGEDAMEDVVRINSVVHQKLAQDFMSDWVAYPSQVSICIINVGVSIVIFMLLSI